MKIKIFYLLFLLFISVNLKSERLNYFEGFEEVGLWGPAGWDVNNGKIELSDKFVTEGKYSLMLEFDSTSQFYKSVIVNEEPYDFSNIEELYVDIYNDSEGINYFTFAVTTGDSWEWHESIEYKLIPGWNKNIKINIGGNFWKARRSEFVNRLSLRNANDVRRIAFNFWGEGGKVYIDNIRAKGNIEFKKEEKEEIGEIKIWESFEGEQVNWQKAGWETKAVSTFRTKEKSTDGLYSLKCNFDGINSSDKATFSCDYSGDWTKIQKIYFDIYNDTGNWLKVTLALSTGGSWTWYESTAKFLAPGWNRNIYFNLNVPKFKTASTKWKNNSYIKFKNAVKRVSLNILGTSSESQKGSIYIDNIRLEEGQPFIMEITPKKPLYLERIVKSKYKLPKIMDLKINSDTIGIYDRFEASFYIDSYYENPFNFKEIEVLANFYSPSGKVYTVPCFINQDFEERRKDLKEVSEPYWSVRFSPVEIGEWRWEVIAKNPAGESKTGKMLLKCAKSDLPGFIKVEGRRFKYYNGKEYIPIGLNVAWVLPEDNWGYKDYINTLSQVGCNWMRIWNATWGNNVIEWGEPEGYGIGFYNLKSCWVIDRIFDEAEKAGIKIQFVINYHDMFVEDGIWEKNPYNYIEGGPCKKPIEFFTNNYAKEFFKKKLRYIIGRWSYSPSLLCWELFNEVDLITDYDESIIMEWHKEMAEYIKSLDPYKHPVSTSFARSTAGESVWNLNEIDYVQTHLYTDDIATGIEKVNEYKTKFGKPHIIGEVGGATTTIEAEAKDKEGIRFKEALFSSILSPLGNGTAMYWWWDGYVKKYDLFKYFDVVSYFIKGINFEKDNLQKAEIQVETEGMGDVIIAPMLDWEKSLDYKFKITSQGELIGGQFSKYLQGKYHKDKLGGGKIFEVKYLSDGEFSIYISTVAKSGARVQIYLDDKLKLDKEFPANPAGDTYFNQELKIEVPKGEHSIKIDNLGLDWVKINYIKFKNVVPQVFAKGLMNEKKGIFWLRNRDYNVENYIKVKKINKLKNVIVYINGFEDGLYKGEIIEPDTGQIIDIGEIKVVNKKMKLEIIPFSRDLLIKINKKLGG